MSLENWIQKLPEKTKRTNEAQVQTVAVASEGPEPGPSCSHETVSSLTHTDQTPPISSKRFCNEERACTCIPTEPVSASSNSEFVDIGSVKIFDIDSATDSLKMSILTSSKFKPPRGWKAPLRLIGKKKRRVPNEVFVNEQYHTISYSPSKDGLYCSVCVVFSHSTGGLVQKPITDWSNCTKILTSHIQSQVHLTAAYQATSFISVCQRKQVTIAESLSKAYKEKVEHNKQALLSILKIVIFCGRQNLPLRGSTDTSATFNALINFRAETDVTLASHLRNAPRNATYLSHRIQNELIELCGDHIIAHIVKKAKEAIFFSVLVDESADVSKTEQVAVCVRYCSLPDYVVEEDFVGFVGTRNTTGETISALLLSVIKKIGLDMNNVVGKGYDGAGNMSGHIRGVQGRIQESYPNATYIHCKAHSLNLAIGSSCKVKPVQNMYDTAQKLLQFIIASPKRLEVYMGNAANYSLPKVKHFCPTRWSARAESTSSIVHCFQPIYDSLVALQSDDDTSVRTTATALANAITKTDFLICLFIADGVLQHTTGLSDRLQAVDCDLVRASDHSKSIVSLLHVKRDDDTYRKLWKSACQLGEEYNVVPSAPRIVRRQQHRANTPAESACEYWRLKVFLTFIDHLISQLEDRLLKPLPRLKAQLILPKYVDSLGTADWEDIKQEYGPLLPSPLTADAELELWKHHVSCEQLESDVKSTVKNTEQFFPNLHVINRVFLTIPVSTASVERCFSALRRLKTYIRSTMSDDRLTGLALMHVHKDVLINSNDILEKFESSGHRRIILAFD